VNAHTPDQLTASGPPSVRLEALTGLRWLAAFWVFGYHVAIFAPLPGLADLPFKLGFLGVTFFFVLSGFVLTWSMRPSLSTSTFYTRRFARIWPTHFVALLLAIPVFYSITPPDPSQDWVKQLSIPVILLSVVLLQGFSRNPEILFSGNPAAWTLSCEMFFYAIHPVLGRLLSRTTLRGALGVAVGAAVAAFVYRAATLIYPEAWWAAGMPLPIMRVSEFVLGMAIAWAIRSGWRPKLPMWLASVIFVLGIIWLTVDPRRAPDSISGSLAAIFMNEFAMVLCALLITAVASQSLRGRSSWLASAWMVRLGNWSYAFYLVHATVIYAAINLFGWLAPSWVNVLWIVGVFVVALALAALLFHFLERPMERRIRSWKDRLDARKILAPVGS
jgi:peptidoglycan/LPS O-acetylase OafA/YrhL